MAFDGGRGIAAGFSDKGHRREFREFVEGAEPGCARAEDGSETLPKVACVNVLSGGHAAEHPVAVRMCCGPVVALRGCQLPLGSVERVWESDVDGTESDGDQARSSVTVTSSQVRFATSSICCPKMMTRNAAARSLGVSSALWTTRCSASPCAAGLSFGACSAPVWGHSETRGSCAGLDGPFQEAIGDAACGGSLGLPGVEVGLLEFGEADSSFVEPVQEFDGHGNRLLASQERSPAHFVHLVHPALVMPPYVTVDELPALWIFHAVEG